MALCTFEDSTVLPAASQICLIRLRPDSHSLPRFSCEIQNVNFEGVVRNTEQAYTHWGGRIPNRTTTIDPGWLRIHIFEDHGRENARMGADSLYINQNRGAWKVFRLAPWGGFTRGHERLLSAVGLAESPF
ncbi:hypothetical protein Vi05172_g9378 [Venturia inaequalis]|nr:hypothetical protein Vi05172_g9378 [Venturia inaequalis]